MIKNRQSFFLRLAKHPSLKENLLSLILAKNPNIDISKRESFADNVGRFYSIHKLEERDELSDTSAIVPSTLDEWLNLDLRIKKINLQALRCFPKSDIPYGIDFTNSDGEISSMVILGGNGSGKSSIYDAIEFSFCRRIGEAELRSRDFFEDNDAKFKDFLSHFNHSFSDATCIIETNSKAFVIDKENIPKSVREKISPNAHFISDFDIYEFGKLNYQSKGDYTFQNQIARNVGLSEYLEIENNLYQFTSYRRLIESNNVNKLNKEIKTAKEIIVNNNKAILEKQTQEKRLKDNGQINDTNNQAKAAIHLIDSLKKVSFSYSFDYLNFKRLTEEFKSQYAQYSTLSYKSESLQEIQFLEMGLSLLEKHDNCPFCNNSKSSKEDINQYVIGKIVEIKNLNDLSNKLNSSANNIIEYFKQLQSSLISLRAKNNEELRKINDKTEFNDLSRIATALDGILGKSVSNDFATDILDIESNINYLKDKTGYINIIISRNEDYINNDLLENSNSISRYERKRQEILAKIENELKAKITTTTAEGQIAILKNDIEILTKENAQLNVEIKSKEPYLLKAISVLELNNKIKTEAIEFYKVLKTELAKETQEAFEPIKDIVATILGEYLYEEDSPVDLIIETKPDEINGETGEIISEIIVAYLKERNSNNPPIPVNKYFNTFHFRLFCTMVGISIAVASRKNTGINLPLVLDDIFYASDFEHRITIERFIKRLFDLFNKHTPDIPLQLLLFTHDQMIFESAISASYENEISNILFAKLFSYQDSSEIEGFKNLINHVPANLPHRIMQNQLI